MEPHRLAAQYTSAPQHKDQTHYVVIAWGRSLKMMQLSVIPQASQTVTV